jgi:hypothetical protein
MLKMARSGFRARICSALTLLLRGLADQRNLLHLGEALGVDVEGVRVEQAHVVLPADHTLEGVVAVEQGEGEEQAAFTQHDALGVAADLDLAPEHVGDGQRFGGQGRPNQPRQSRAKAAK